MLISNFVWQEKKSMHKLEEDKGHAMSSRGSSFCCYFTVLTVFMIIQKFRDVLVILLFL